MATILLIEDAKDCQILVTESLAKVATLRIASTLEAAREELSRNKFDLIILDLGLPDGDGMEFFSKIQGSTAALSGEESPVIFLTAKNESSVQVTAFSLGAEDFVVKPFRPLEFRARVEAKLKKIAQSKLNEASLVRGDLLIELQTQRVYAQSTVGSGNGETRVEKQEIELTGREFKLLCHLARHEGTVFSRDQLISSVWGGGVHVLDRTVDTHIYTLRKKLGPHAHCVQSEVGLGYRFDGSPESAVLKDKKGKTAA